MRFTIAIIWVIIIAILHAVPPSSAPDFSFTSFVHLDKLIHIILFMFGVYFFAIAYEEKQKQFFLFPIIISFVFYGGFLEVMQGIIFEDRISDIYDFVADIIGIFIGGLIFKKFPSGVPVNYIKKD